MWPICGKFMEKCAEKLAGSGVSFQNKICRAELLLKQLLCSTPAKAQVFASVWA